MSYFIKCRDCKKKLTHEPVQAEIAFHVEKGHSVGIEYDID